MSKHNDMTPNELKAFQMLQKHGKTEALNRANNNLEMEKLAYDTESFSRQNLDRWNDVVDILNRNDE